MTAADANTAPSGGGIAIRNLGLVRMQSGSRVSGNSATSEGGGIIVLVAVQANGTSLHLENGSQITGNHADGPGGGIVIDNSSSEPGFTHLFNGSRVSGNTAGSNSGIVNRGTLTVDGGALVCGNDGPNQCLTAVGATTNGDCPSPQEGGCPAS